MIFLLVKVLCPGIANHFIQRGFQVFIGCAVSVKSFRFEIIITIVKLNDGIATMIRQIAIGFFKGSPVTKTRSIRTVNIVMILVITQFRMIYALTLHFTGKFFGVE